MPSALVSLANITLGSAAATVTFSSISGSYKDLCLVFNGTTVNNGAGLQMRFNGDSGANYANVYMYGTGSATGSGSTTTSLVYLGVLGTSNTVPSVTTVNIMDYSATDKHKSVLVREDSSANGVQAIAARWANTAAITSLVIDTGSGNIAAGSTFSLFGVSA